MPDRPDDRALILVVDDEPTNLQLMRRLLDQDYRLLFAKDGERALELARAELPQLILLDVMMPGMTGHETCRRLKADPRTAGIPIIFITALIDTEDEVVGFEAGAVDYINKPVSAPILRARVRTHLSLVHLDELRQSRLELVQRLGRAAEYKDSETGYHVVRMSHYAARMALSIGQSEGWVEMLRTAAPMHDVGKIGIPDQILTKPGRLTPEEWAVMQTHPAIGAKIIGEHADPMLRMAYIAALTHHEKWDGSGYPAGLAGEAIPLEGRLVAVADVFDALTSKRPYKRPWTNEEAADLIKSEAGRHFDPQIVEAFLRSMPEILAIQRRYVD
jgi:putative two-component system response regulator